MKHIWIEDSDHQYKGFELLGYKASIKISPSPTVKFSDIQIVNYMDLHGATFSLDDVEGNNYEEVQGKIEKQIDKIIERKG